MSEIRARAPLFDRLVDQDPGSSREAKGRPLRALTRQELRESVRRELERLLNTRSSLPAHLLDERELTVLEYGIPDLSGFSAGDPADHERLAAVVARAITAFEPRLRDVRVVVESFSPTERRLRLGLQAALREEPSPEPLSFPTVISLGGGEAVVELAPEPARERQRASR